MGSPSEIAHIKLRSGIVAAQKAFDQEVLGEAKTNTSQVLDVLSKLGEGMDSMNTGLRAIFMKLDQIEAEVKCLKK